MAALALGLRRGELLGISWDDLQLDGPMPLVRIRQQLLRHGRQGVLLADLKSAGSRRTLQPSQPLVDLLRAHRICQNVEEQAARFWWNSANLVFTSTIGRRSIPRPSAALCRESASGPAWGTGAFTSCATPAPRRSSPWACRSRSSPTRWDTLQSE